MIDDDDSNDSVKQSWDQKQPKTCRCVATIAAIEDVDPVKWPCSMWKSLQVITESAESMEDLDRYFWVFVVTIEHGRWFGTSCRA
jgi:hypothetical protein